MFWITTTLTIFLLCAVISGFVIPQVLLIAYRRKLFDEPGGRHIHTVPVPRLGGLAFVPVILFSLSLCLGVSLFFHHTDIPQAMQGQVLSLSMAFCAVMLLYVVGVADDLIGVKYRAKFAAQIVAALLLVIGALRVTHLGGILFVHQLPLLASVPLTLFVVVFIINAINLIDGIDGLASGLCISAFAVYGVSFALIGQWLYVCIAAACLGVLIPFFYYNVFGNADHHRKIFMGDTGALTMGVSLCILAFRIQSVAPAHHAIEPFVLAFAPVLIPCMDLTRVYFHRLRKGRNPFLPDKSHIHHKLLAAGMHQRQAMITIVASALLFTAANCALSPWIDTTLLLILDAIVVTAVNLLLNHLGHQRKMKSSSGQ